MREADKIHNRRVRKLAFKNKMWQSAGCNTHLYRHAEDRLKANMHKAGSKS